MNLFFWTRTARGHWLVFASSSVFAAYAEFLERRDIECTECNSWPHNSIKICRSQTKPDICSRLIVGCQLNFWHFKLPLWSQRLDRYTPAGYHTLQKLCGRDFWKVVPATCLFWGWFSLAVLSLYLVQGYFELVGLTNVLTSSTSLSVNATDQAFVFRSDATWNQSTGRLRVFLDQDMVANTTYSFKFRLR